MPVTVALDTGPLIGTRTGVGQFVQRLVDGLAHLDAPPTVLPYVLSARAALPDGTRRLRLPAAAALRAWGRADAPRADRTLRGAQVVHGPNYVVPPSDLPTVVSVHDCWFLRYPDLASPNVRLFGPVLRRAVRRGVTVHVPSRHTAEQVEELLGATQVVVLPLGAPRRVLGPTVPLAGLDGRPYVLAIGAKEPRKNLARLVAAFGRVADEQRDVALVLLGPDGPDQPAIDDAIAALPHDAADRVLLVSYVSDAERNGILAGAAALAFPSLDEGWGFPALEAMAAGVPVVAADAGSLPEVCGDAAVLVDPLDVDDIARGLATVLDDRAERARLVRAGTARVETFDPVRCAGAFADLYTSLAGGSS